MCSENGNVKIKPRITTMNMNVCLSLNSSEIQCSALNLFTVYSTFMVYFRTLKSIEQSNCQQKLARTIKKALRTRFPQFKTWSSNYLWCNEAEFMFFLPQSRKCLEHGRATALRCVHVRLSRGNFNHILHPMRKKLNVSKILINWENWKKTQNLSAFAKF